jgi:hypothetical protein
MKTTKTTKTFTDNSEETMKYIDFVYDYGLDDKLTDFWTGFQQGNDFIEATGDPDIVDMIAHLSPTMYKVSKTFKKCKDYKLEIDQSFFTKAEITEFTGATTRTIDRWIEKGWIKENKLSKIS